jgi:hypothetical protein
VYNGDGGFHRSGGFAGALQHREARPVEGGDWKPLSLEEVQKAHIQRVLGMCQGNRLRAAQFLGIGRTSLYRYLKRDGLDTRKEKSGGAAAVMVLRQRAAGWHLLERADFQVPTIQLPSVVQRR